MKRFVLKTIIMIVPIVCLFVYYNLCVSPHRHGDLGLLGYMAFNDEYDTCMIASAMDSLLVTQIDNLSQIDTDSAILTVGDSFSQQGKYGYQNYLAHLYPDFKVYNLNPKGKSHEENYQFIVDCIISNDKLPAYVVIESVERILIERLANLSLSQNGAQQRISAYQYSLLSDVNPEADVCSPNGIQTTKEKVRDFIDRIRQTQEFIKKKLDINNPVKYLELKRNLFTCQGEERNLYFYQDDLCEQSSEMTNRAQHKLDSLIDYVERHNVNFVLLVASDKYDLYKQFAVDDNYNVPGNLEYFSTYNDNPHFINSKQLLNEHVVQGEKDIYKCNDTHWSIKAAKYVATEIKRKLSQQTH